MAENTTYFITGANKGIGLALVRELLSRPRHTIIASVRDLSTFNYEGVSNPHPSSNWTVGEGSRVLVVKIDATYASDVPAAIETIKQQGVNHINTVIANAGAASGFKPVLETTDSEMLSDFETNVLGPLRLYQATYPLLVHGGMFMYITSALGSIGVMEHESAPALSYGASKCSGNFMTKKIHVETAAEKGIVSVAVHPGWARTDMGQKFADSVGAKGGNMGVDESVRGIVEIIDNATREKTGGKFLMWNGNELPW